MIGLKIETNIDSVIRKFKRHRRWIAPAYDKVLENGGKEVQLMVQAVTPNDTSSLQGSIRSKKVKRYVYEIKARQEFAKGTRVERYVKPIAEGRGKPLTRSKNRNARAKANGRGAYRMFDKAKRPGEKLIERKVEAFTREIERRFNTVK